MNEKLQYATMLEMPVSTSSVTALPKKRRFFKRKRVNDELIKQELLKKVNQEQDLTENQGDNLIVEESEKELLTDNQQEMAQGVAELEQNTSSVYISSQSHKKSTFKVTVIGVQLFIIGVLVATIFLTNALYENSGINVFLRGVFGVESTVVDNREHTDFSPVIYMGDNNGVAINNGIITFAGEGSVYAPCDGVVTKISQTESGKYDIEIEHSKNFKSVISNVEHIYVSEGDVVYGNIPVGYLEPDGATLCFTLGNGELLDGYQIVGNMVVWQA